MRSILKGLLPMIVAFIPTVSVLAADCPSGFLGVSWKSSWQDFEKLTGIKLSQERVESSDDNLVYLRSLNHPVILGKRANLVLTGFWKKEMFLGGIDVRKNDGKD